MTYNIEIQEKELLEKIKKYDAQGFCKDWENNKQTIEKKIKWILEEYLCGGNQ